MICTLNSVMRDLTLYCRTTLRLPHSCAVLQDNQLKFEFILQTVWKFTVHYVRVQHQHINQHGFLHVLQANIVSSNYFTTILWSLTSTWIMDSSLVLIHRTISLRMYIFLHHMYRNKYVATLFFELATAILYLMPMICTS